MKQAEATLVPPYGERPGIARPLLPAVLFGTGFWALDTVNAIWLSGVDLVSAILPAGNELFFRSLTAAGFAAAGALICRVMTHYTRREAWAVQRTNQTEYKYQALLSSSFEAILTVDGDERVVELSNSAAELFGVDKNTLSGRPVDDVLSFETAARTGAAGTLGEQLRTGRFRERESIAVYARTIDGRNFPAEIRITPIPGSGNNRYVVAVRETTDQVVAQKALRRSETQYRVLFDNILDGVYRSRPDGTLLAANPSLVRMLGFASRESLLADGNTNDFYKDPSQRTKIIALLEQHGVARNVEIRLRRRDGSPMTVLANVRAISDGSGVGIVYEGTVTDISDLIQTRAALEDSEEHFRALTENARDIVNVIDEQGRILYCSPSVSALSSKSPAELVGTDFFRGIHGDDVDNLRRVIEQGFVRPGTPQEFTCKVYASDRSLRHFEGVGKAYMTRHGELRAVIHSRDITERLAADARLRAFQRTEAALQRRKGLRHDMEKELEAVLAKLGGLRRDVDAAPPVGCLDAAEQACRQAIELNRRLNSGIAVRETETSQGNAVRSVS